MTSFFYGHNQLEKLEAAKAAYLWLPFLTFPCLPLVTFGYLSLPFLTFPYWTLFILTEPYFAFV